MIWQNGLVKFQENTHGRPKGGAQAELINGLQKLSRKKNNGKKK